MLCGCSFSSALEMVSGTRSNCDTDGRELYYSNLCSLLCPETNIIWRSETFASESNVMAKRPDEVVGVNVVVEI